jgi:hypothetical protein
MTTKQPPLTSQHCTSSGPIRQLVGDEGDGDTADVWRYA